jgi:hypothetical protein
MSIAVGSRDSWLNWFAIWKIVRGEYGPFRTAILALIVLVLSTIFYGMAYRLCLRVGISVAIEPITGSERTFTDRGEYSIQSLLPDTVGPAVEFFFEPAHQVDRFVRRSFWSSGPIRILSPDELKEFLSDLTPEELEEIHQLRTELAEQGNSDH